jgi:hypothetical protein
MKDNLKKYWFEFEIDKAVNYPMGIGIGCGVTAIDYKDAIKIMEEKIFKKIKSPRILKTIENIHISKLDQEYVIPNMGAVIYRGIWFPLGYE